MCVSSKSSLQTYILLSDIDECAQNSFTCSSNAVCINTVGSYRCRCNAGFNGDGTTCSGERITVCFNQVQPTEGLAQKHENYALHFQMSMSAPRMGFCAVGMQYAPTPSATTHACATLDSLGMVPFVLVREKSPFSSFAHTCTKSTLPKRLHFLSDINECAQNTFTCSTDAVCTNTVGSYRCLCNPGFTGDGTTCTGENSFWVLFNLSFCRWVGLTCTCAVITNKPPFQLLLKTVHFIFRY